MFSFSVLLFPALSGFLQTQTGKRTMKKLILFSFVLIVLLHTRAALGYFPYFPINLSASSLQYCSIAVYPDFITLLWSAPSSGFSLLAFSHSSGMPSLSESFGGFPGVRPAIRSGTSRRPQVPVPLLTSWIVRRVITSRGRQPAFFKTSS